jgi:putative ABC transport system permease protein
MRESGGELRSWLVRYRYNLVTAFRLALDSIRAHKLRSFLTLLGVIIGVASVVIVGAAIEGLGVYAEESTAKVFGSETYVVAQVAGIRSRKEFFDHIRRNKPIRSDDLKFLQASTGNLILYSPYNYRTEDVKHRDLTFEDANILGVSAAIPEMRDIGLVEGRFFTEAEERSRQAVAVIGEDLRAKLFPTSSAVGRTVKIRGIDFVVVGVQEKLGSSFGRSQDNGVYIPYTLFTRLYGTGRSIAIFGRARPNTGLTLETALDITRVALRTRFRTRPGEADRFDTVTPDAIRSFIDQILGLISVVVVPVTCMSLVVGGIVIMNIMLVSVTERTREIGIRKSLGARTSDIRLQFLLEAVLMAAVGGAIGVLTGAALTQALAQIFEISLRITLSYVFLALMVSSAVGIASGWYPARRAARMDPIVALRAE